MIGFEIETEMLIEKLVTGPRQLDVISIFGMPGLGKTILAKRLYDHEAISNRFDIRLWCCSSQSYDKRSLLFELLNHICKYDTSTKEKSDDELAEMLYKYLKGKRYLIVVDDVWSQEAWDDIIRSFPDDDTGSRIILTSRLESIATYAMIDSSPHFLRMFTEEESWMLMKQKVFKEDNCYCPQQLEEIGKQIASKCGGLPLAVILVAGLLAKHDKEVVYWQEVGESLKSKIQGCMDIVESSYQHLPIHLQKCFLYFASFLEDQKVPVQKLIRLWIAENFVEASSTLKSLEMVAMDYLMDLISSNLVMVAKINSLGELKSIHIHDLIREFSLVKAKNENFLLRINRIGEFCSSRGSRLRRGLGIFPSPESCCKRVNILAPSELLLGERFRLGQNINTLRFLPGVYSPIVDYDLTWKHLRVLDLGSVRLRQTLVDALQHLIHLKYLELQLYFHNIPSSVCNLKKLETFIVFGYHDQTCIPITIWNMKRLRHLHISPLYTNKLLHSLDNLQTCSDLVVSPGMYYRNFMKRFSNLEKLSCQLYGSGTTSGNFFPAFETLGKLKSLKIGVSGAVVDPYGFENFTYPSNLKKLTLVYLRLPWSKLSTIGTLSNLEVLKLEESSFIGRKWDVNDGEFPTLKVLKLKKLGFSEWTASDDSYPNLQKVLVHSCWSLEEIPECFGSNCTLQLIELRSCGDDVVNSALKIKEMQIEEMGNSEFKVIISK